MQPGIVVCTAHEQQCWDVQGISSCGLCGKSAFQISVTATWQQSVPPRPLPGFAAVENLQQQNPSVPAGCV